MTELLLGIDCGSSVTKAALFDLEGRELASASSGTKTVTRRNGSVERSSAGIWVSVIGAVRRVVADSGLDAGAVVAIGCSGHGNGLYGLDARGDVLVTAYQSLDSRADAIVREWEQQGFGDQLFEDGWQRLWPGQPFALLEWLRRNELDAYEAIAMVLLCKDFVNYKLTGRAVSDYSDMSAAGLLSNAQLTYNERLFELLGLDGLEAKLPPLVASTEVIGTLSASAADELGLPAETPVVGGLFDVAASAVGSGGAAEDCLSLVAGTWSINALVTRQPLIDRSLLMTTVFADGRRWMAIAASGTSAANLNWFASEAFVDHDAGDAEGSVFDRCCEVASTAELRLSSPIYHPFLYGSPSDSRARAGFYGIAGSDTRADMARAVLEGVAFGHRRHVDDLFGGGATAARARLTGGGARSAFWAQMFADVLEIRIEVPDAEETGARGAALAAGVGIGVFRDIDEAMSTATGVASSYQPNPHRASVYTRRFKIYRELVDVLGPVWQALASADDQVSPMS